MSNLVSEAVYRDFEKQIAYRERHRKRKQEREDNYAGKVENIQNEKFEQIKRQAINAVNTESVFLQPGVVRNYLHRNSEDREELKEIEETKQDIVEEEEDENTMTKEQKMWKEFGDLLHRDKKTVQAIRQDTFEGAEISRQAKQALEAKRKASEEEDDGFVFASSHIVMMEAKAPKKRKRGGRH